MISTIIIPGETPSLKNSKQFKYLGNPPRPRLVPSDFYLAWRDGALWSLKTSPLIGYSWDYPVRVDFEFLRSTRRRFDMINLAQGPLDILVELGILADDDMRHVVPGRFAWGIDKHNPRAILRLIDCSTSPPERIDHEPDKLPRTDQGTASP